MLEPGQARTQGVGVGGLSMGLDDPPLIWFFHFLNDKIYKLAF